MCRNQSFSDRLELFTSSIINIVPFMYICTFLVRDTNLKNFENSRRCINVLSLVHFLTDWTCFYIVYLYHYPRSMLDLFCACDQYLKLRKLTTKQKCVEFGPFSDRLDLFLYIVCNPHWTFYAHLYHYQRSTMDISCTCDQSLKFKTSRQCKNVVNSDFFWQIGPFYIVYNPHWTSYVHLYHYQRSMLDRFLSVPPICKIPKTRDGAQMCWIWTFFWQFRTHKLVDLFSSLTANLRFKDIVQRSSSPQIHVHHIFCSWGQP